MNYPPLENYHTNPQRLGGDSGVGTGGGRHGYTMIDDLPDVSDIDGPSAHVPAGMAQQYGGLIRQNPRNLPMESGMNQVVPLSEGYRHTQHNEYYDEEEQYSPGPSQGPLTNTPKPSMNYNEPSCIDVCNHITSCPLCSKFYNHDRTSYMIIIIILSIICLILLKKVLNV